MQARHRFETEIASIRRQTLNLGATVEQSLQMAIRALSDDDEELATTVIENDEKIGRRGAEIQNCCTLVIATQHPVARDLRQLIATMQVASELERIGDHARHLAEGAGSFCEPPLQRWIPQISGPSALAAHILGSALAAFAALDVAAAHAVIEKDGELDRLCWESHRSLLALMRDNPATVDSGTSLMFLNRFVERLGDHAVAVCHWVLFAGTGRRDGMP
jgi:phosphate transport system protein